jgi:hypothetical protein
VLFDLFIDDLVHAVDTACTGVALPVPDDADALLLIAGQALGGAAVRR